VTLSWLIGIVCKGWADSYHFVGAPGHVAEANAGDVAEVQKHRWVALVEHLEPAGAQTSVIVAQLGGTVVSNMSDSYRSNWQVKETQIKVTGHTA